MRFRHVRDGAVITVHGANIPRYQRDDRWAAITDDDGGELKGAALDEALDAAGLSKAGAASEKRARLAEYQAAGALTP